MSDTVDRSYSFLRCRVADAADKHARSSSSAATSPTTRAPLHPSTGDRPANPNPNPNRPREVDGP
ncbi:hypothetical protein ROP_00840 [Rhodococcus opacus B4]|uniref:Uncharacterized protein n=1 Tax=Rhodococcus opacus (strain B4) TaxID=632772 RepID=C1AS82_RHOOB|nr:hypothetical protein ROP_00840 [Rhodococcus opacus B4]